MDHLPKNKRYLWRLHTKNRVVQCLTTCIHTLTITHRVKMNFLEISYQYSSVLTHENKATQCVCQK